MNCKLILLITLLTLCTTVTAEEHKVANAPGGANEEIAKVRIVTEHCDERLNKLMGEMIKYYIDRGDFDSADVLIQVVKKSHMTDIPQSNKTLKPKTSNDIQVYEHMRRWIFGYF